MPANAETAHAGGELCTVPPEVVIVVAAAGGDEGEGGAEAREDGVAHHFTQAR